jgi:hypothetical protein
MVILARHIVETNSFRPLDEPYIYYFKIFSGHQWKRDRKTFHPAFNHQLFDGFIKIFDQEAKTLVKKLKEKFENSSNQSQNIYHMLVTAALEMVYRKFIVLKINNLMTWLKYGVFLLCS